MFKIFTKKNKKENKISEEIKDSFYNEVFRLLSLRGVWKYQSNTNINELIDKSKKLKSIGFSNTKEAKELQDEILRLQDENEEKEAIRYFTKKYPNYSFITQNSVNKICEKHNIFCKEVEKYIGSIPEENIRDIEKLIVAENDECYMSFTETSLRNIRITEYFDYKEYRYKSSFKNRLNSKMIAPIEMYEKCPLEIISSLYNFNRSAIEDLIMNESVIRGCKVLNPKITPVFVLKPVVFNNKKYYLLVTSWE